MKQKRPGIVLPLIGIVMLFFTLNSCTKSNSANDQNSRINIYLTDAPGNYQAVWIDIQQVMVKNSSDNSDQGWISVPLLRPGRYNLLALRNGQDTILGGVSLPAGPVSQIRLVLGNDNQLVLEDGTTVDLKTPSAQESGLKLNVHADLIAGIPYELVMDFDAARSIVKAGNSGQYLLKPVIRTFAKAAGGAIQGVVLPGAANAQVMAIAGVDTLGAIPDASGAYKFWGIPANTYTLIFAPDITTDYMPDTLKNIAVTIGNVTNVDTVRLVR
jgi:hypothetical protein